MMEIGCLARDFNKYSEEVEFAKKHNFKFMQIWYDRNGISLKKDENPVEEIKKHSFPSIIHAVLDINEFEEHVPNLLEILKYLEHKELIIHPICESEEITENSIHKLSEKVKYALEVLFGENITLYLENNSRLDPIFNKTSEIEIMFKNNPKLEFILDLAHIDDYDHLKEIIKIKNPKVLHIADRHLENIHEHLPIGQGNIDYEFVFNNILNDFNGKAVLEIIQSSEDIINSRAKIEEFYKAAIKNTSEAKVFKYNNNIKVKFTDKKVNLPEDYVEEVEKYWIELMSKGKPFSRGVVFTIDSIEKDKENANIFVKTTDYAHYLYTAYKRRFTQNDCRVIHTSALIETSDKKYVLGEMNVTTSSPYRLQFIGGGLDKDDIKGDIVDLEHNMIKEISEELGIDVNNSSIVKKLEPCYLTSGGDSSFISAVFKLELVIDESELLDIFNKHNEHQISQGISPELISLTFIPADKESVEQFIANESREINHNVIPIFKAATGLCKIENFSSLK